MSRSITELLKSLSDNKISELPDQEDKLVNPDIPEIDEKDEIRDMFYNNYRMQSAPRNGMYSLPRAGNIMYTDPRKDDFLLDGSIDPNTIRAKNDPDTAMPTMAGGVKFSLMPDSVNKAHDYTNLIKKSHESEYNYRNRYAYTPPSNK